MRNPPLLRLTWVAILCTAGCAAGVARAQPPSTDPYGVHAFAGSAPGARQAVPDPPQRPLAATRPPSWPSSDPGTDVAHRPSPPSFLPEGTPGEHGSPLEQRGTSRLPGRTPDTGRLERSSGHADVAHAKPFFGAHVVARVGNEAITVSDVLAQVPSIVDRNREQMSDDDVESQREALTRDLTRAMEEAFARRNGPGDQWIIQSEQLRAQMLGQILKMQIQTLLVFLDAQRNIPAEGFPEVRRQIDDGFDKQLLPDLMKRAGAGSRRELDEFLRGQGTSLEREKRTFFQQTLAQQWIRQHVDFDQEITHEQMLQYYRKHPDEFDREARTVWEHLCVQFVDQPSQQEARAAIAHMGNRVLGGEPLAEVAKDASQGPTAADGGRRVWPDEDRYLSEELERAVHGLPVGQLSPIIRDWRGLHIARVVERTPAGRVSFEEAQEEIRAQIREERIQKQIDQYISELKRRTPVWTVLDPPQTP